MFQESTKAMLSAVRLLVKSPRTLVLLLAVYAGLLAAVYLFVSTREATVAQLLVTLLLLVLAPALFFVLQALSVSYTSGCLIKKVSKDSLRLVVASLPVIGLTLLALFGLDKLQINVPVVSAMRYLLIGVVAPLLAIQLWIAASAGGLRSLRGWKPVLARTFAPQPVFIYTCGFLVFAVVPYFLLIKTMSSQRAWLEFSLLFLRLLASALFVLLGWVTTVGAIALLNQPARADGAQD